MQMNLFYAFEWDEWPPKSLNRKTFVSMIWLAIHSILYAYWMNSLKKKGIFAGDNRKIGRK